jgi:(E)-4-hydroxy-3-methylbut-2-enyl-diphosphate synthase
MKASNPQVAIHAYRLLAARLAGRAAREAGLAADDPRRFELPGYPFHVGVTEAGDGEEGRVKSAIGIGALLEDGIGDTIRVSLTEDPVREVPVARALARRYDARFAKPAAGPESGALPRVPEPGAPFVADPCAHARRVTRLVRLGRDADALEAGGDRPVRVELDLGPAPPDAAAAVRELAAGLARAGELACEGLLVEALPGELPRAAAFVAALGREGITTPVALRVEAAFAEGAAALAARLVVVVDVRTSGAALQRAARAAAAAGIPLEWCLQSPLEGLAGLLDAALAASRAGGAADLLFSAEAPEPVHAARLLAARLAAAGAARAPLVLRHRSDPFEGEEAALLRAAVDLGAPLCDGLGDVVSLGGFAPPERALRLAYRILQGARLRTSWTEFISCPSCGRTQFDLEETTARIKARTAHLKGLKIAVMGCIVNGPGEMADADFGYVGSGPGKVNLYVGHECVVRNVPEAEAPERLVALIRERGAWVEP